MPGFLASRIVNAIAVRRAKSHLGEVIDALIFSFLIYATLYAVGCGVVVMSESANGSFPQVDSEHVWYALVLAVLFALAYGGSINHDLHMRVLRLMKIAVGTARVNPWIDVFTEQEGGVVINYTDGRRLTGWPAFFSDDPKEGLIYLRSPAWVDDSGGYVRIEVDGILIVDRGKIDSITFLRGENGNA